MRIFVSVDSKSIILIGFREQRFVYNTSKMVDDTIDPIRNVYILSVDINTIMCLDVSKILTERIRSEERRVGKEC